MMSLYTMVLMLLLPMLLLLPDAANIKPCIMHIHYMPVLRFGDQVLTRACSIVPG